MEPLGIKQNLNVTKLTATNHFVVYKSKNPNCKLTKCRISKVTEIRQVQEKS